MRKKNKRIYIIGVINCLSSVIASLTIIILAQEYTLGIRELLLTILALVILFIGIGTAIYLDREACIYVCKYCGVSFKPSILAYICGIHTLNKRYLCCPNCSNKGFFSKRYRDNIDFKYTSN